MDKGLIAVLVFAVRGTLLVASIGISEMKANSFCKEKGFMRGNTMDVESGYILCSGFYDENHLLDRSHGQVFKYIK